MRKYIQGVPPRVVDAVITVLVVTLCVADGWLEPSYNAMLTGAPMWAIAAVSGAVGVSVWWRRRYPLAVAAIALAGYVIAFTPAAVAVAIFTVGNVRRRLRGLAACAVIAVSAGMLSLIYTSGSDAALWEAGYVLTLILSPLIVGDAVASRRDLTLRAQAELDGLAREQDLRVERARIEERERIAREMHDVVAHRVGNMVLTAAALRMNAAPGRRRTDAAQLIESEGRQALEELREILGVLTPGRGGQRPTRAPQPDATQLPQLVESACQMGHPAQLRVNGYPEALRPPVQRALYRVVQESLTNVAKHAPGAPVRVEVDCGIDGVHLTVVNGASTRPSPSDLPSGRNGLVGLSERVQLVGGTLSHGRSGDGFAVNVMIPHAPASLISDAETDNNGHFGQ
ncbi:histidine kinase [Streptomyces pathocidini]|uniref:sensor histidine kinase n=1 Tax=Streptomyces pathocidini TaxID=1650571 RepID=UPI0033CDFC88